MSEGKRQMTRKTIQAVCRICRNDFRGQAGSYRCPRCKQEDQRYKAQREKLKKRLPFYLKTDM
jgi:Zn finger protein HypA/HybF involved in hydrogenase expression